VKYLFLFDQTGGELLRSNEKVADIGIYQAGHYILKTIDIDGTTVSKGIILIK